MTSLRSKGGFDIEALRGLYVLASEVGTAEEVAASGGHLGLALAKAGNPEARTLLEAAVASLDPREWVTEKAKGQLKRL